MMLSRLRFDLSPKIGHAGTGESFRSKCTKVYLKGRSNLRSSTEYARRQIYGPLGFKWGQCKNSKEIINLVWVGKGPAPPTRCWPKISLTLFIRERVGS